MSGVRKYDEVDTNDLRVKKPVRIHGSFVIFNVTYGARDKLLIQTPPLSLVRNPCVEKRGGGSVAERVTLHACGKTKKHVEFFDTMEAVHTKVLRKLLPVYGDMFEGKSRVRRAWREEGEGDHDDRMMMTHVFRFRNAKPAIQVFDATGHVVDIGSLMVNQNVVMLLCVDHVWVGETHYDIEVRVVQIMKHEYDCGGCLLVGDPPKKGPPPPPPRPPPPPPPPPSMRTGGAAPSSVLPDKYAKMLKMGVPRQAVDNAMLMDGVTTLRGGPPPPPPPPPPTLRSISNNTAAAAAADPMGAVLSQIHGGKFALKTVTDAEKSRTSLPPPEKTERGGGWRKLVPSLSDILGAKNRLKTVFGGSGGTEVPRQKEFTPHNTFPFLDEIRRGDYALKQTRGLRS